jgi:hypothetical protein
MATRNFAYDHPAYRVPVVLSGAMAAGASSNLRFVAHADMIAKNVVSRIITAGTSTTSAAATVYKVSGTTTTSIGAVVLNLLTANGSSVANALSDAAITKGDEIRIANGTDATAVIGHAIELVVTPGADFTV